MAYLAEVTLSTRDSLYYIVLRTKLCEDQDEHSTLIELGLDFKDTKNRETLQLIGQHSQSQAAGKSALYAKHSTEPSVKYLPRKAKLNH
jgi:hypothetical protein